MDNKGRGNKYFRGLLYKNMDMRMRKKQSHRQATIYRRKEQETCTRKSITLVVLMECKNQKGEATISSLK